MRPADAGNGPTEAAVHIDFACPEQLQTLLPGHVIDLCQHGVNAQGLHLYPQGKRLLPGNLPDIFRQGTFHAGVLYLP